jgi:hypothetical protein
VFLIGGKAAAPAPVPAPTNMTTKNTTPVPVNVTPNSTEHNWTLSKPMPAPQEPSLLIWLLLGTLTVLVLGGLVLAFRRHKAVPAKVHSHYSLREYIEVCRKKGLTLEEIKERLLQAGWKEEVIGPVLAEYAQK